MKMTADKPPALPKAWPTGRVTGLCARGGYTVDITWQDGKVTACRVASATPREVKVRVNGQTMKIPSEKKLKGIRHHPNIKHKTVFPGVAVLALFVSAWCGVAACAAEENQAHGENGAAESGAPNPALEEAIKKLKMPGVAINLQERCVDIEGKICLDRGTLELVACTKGTKEHESIVVIEARPMHIHAALLLLGAQPGNPAMRKLLDEKKQRWIDLPPSGNAVKVLLVFPDKAEKLVEHPISEFITRSAEDSGVADEAAADEEGDPKFPHTFLFAGSHLVDDESGPRKYLSDLSGNVISIATFGDELLCLPGTHSDSNEALAWQVNATGLPAVGSKVTLRLRPQLAPASNAGKAGQLPSDSTPDSTPGETHP